MSDHRDIHWDPLSDEVTRDQRAAYDAMRERCPIAFSDALHWSVFRHADIMRVLVDEPTFGNAVSPHLSVPNGMDPPEHTRYRAFIDPYFGADRMEALEPACRESAARLVGDALNRPHIEAMSELASPFAAACQCAFLGWSGAYADRLLDWMRLNQQATGRRDRPALAGLAAQFDALIGEVLEERRTGGPWTDATAALMREQVDGRPLHDHELVSILRNWTAGEVGTIAASVGIVLHDLAAHPERQAALRAAPSFIPPVVDEILRAHGPLVASRRVTRQAVELGGQQIAAGERLTLMWISGNRDPRAFDQPDAVRLDRDTSQNLLYGAGIHVCPGAPLARLELRVIVEEVLRQTTEIVLTGDAPAVATYPASGWSSLALRLR